MVGRTSLANTASCLLLAGSVAIATLAVAHHPAAEVLIGFANPLTGEMELAAEQMQNGVELAVAELNASGGVLGQKVVVDLADDYCDAEQGLAAARKLVADGVVVVIGHLCSGTAIPVSLFYEEAGIPLITLAANPLLTDRGLRFTFRSSPPDDANAKFTAQHMVRQLAAKRIAIVHDSRVYGKGLGDLTRRNLEELGTPPVLFEAMQPGQLVFADLIQQLRGAEIDVVADPAVDCEAVAVHIRDGLLEAGLREPVVHVSRVDALARNPVTGKLKRFVPLAPDAT